WRRNVISCHYQWKPFNRPSLAIAASLYWGRIGKRRVLVYKRHGVDECSDGKWLSQRAGRPRPRRPPRSRRSSAREARRETRSPVGLLRVQAGSDSRARGASRCRRGRRRRRPQRRRGAGVAAPPCWRHYRRGTRRRAARRPGLPRSGAAGAAAGA
ncbi:unnamed protein product, partial [Phaeothamnion confervicola]